MTPRIIFWDVGNTLIRSHTGLTMARLSRLSGKTPKEISEAVSPKDDSLFSVFDCAMLGTIGTRRFIRSIRKRLGLKHSFISHRCILRTFLGTCELPKEICYLLYFLKGRTPMGIISNTIKLSWRHIEDTFPSFRLESGVFNWRFLSCREGIMKPEREMYARAYLAARELLGNSLTPYDCLFFDDKPENILSAQVFGFRAIRVAKAGDPKIFETLSALGMPLPPPDFTPPRYVVPPRNVLEKKNP